MATFVKSHREKARAETVVSTIKEGQQQSSQGLSGSLLSPQLSEVTRKDPGCSQW